MLHNTLRALGELGKIWFNTQGTPSTETRGNKEDSAETGSRAQRDTELSVGRGAVRGAQGALVGQRPDGRELPGGWHG